MLDDITFGWWWTGTNSQSSTSKALTWIQCKLGKQYLVKKFTLPWESNPGPTPIRGDTATLIASVGLKKNSAKSYMMASLNLCVHISRASTSLMVQKGADKRKDEDLMKGLKTTSKMLNLQILKCFQHLSKLIKTMMGSSPWKNMSRFSGSKS